MSTTMNDATNPFTPPRAAVADIDAAHDGEVQLPGLWTSKGRIGRLRYLCYVSVGYLLCGAIAGGAAAAGLAGGGGAAAALGLVYIAAVIPYLVFSILAGIKRSHDMDWSGWTILLAIFVPFAAFIWLFKSGSKGRNRFGPPPAPNTMGIRIGGLILPVVMIIGIVAAIAVPAYQQYQKRAAARAAGYTVPGAPEAPSLGEQRQ